jgi:oxidase EvaA
MEPGGALHTADELRSWLTEIRAVTRLDQRVIPLDAVKGWTRGPDKIYREDGKYFEVIAADVRASNREVTAWTQPLVAPVQQGRLAFLVRRFDGVAHVLLQARVEGGAQNVAELAPTVQCMPVNYAGRPMPRFYDVVRDASPGQIRSDSVQSEEGGRFFHADNRYQVIEVGDEIPADAGSAHRWVTPHQIARLLQHPNYVNIQARSLYTALHTTW